MNIEQLTYLQGVLQDKKNDYRKTVNLLINHHRSMFTKNNLAYLSGEIRGLRFAIAEIGATLASDKTSPWLK